MPKDAETVVLPNTLLIKIGTRELGEMVFTLMAIALGVLHAAGCKRSAPCWLTSRPLALVCSRIR